jgi:hypothetical protein
LNFFKTKEFWVNIIFNTLFTAVVSIVCSYLFWQHQEEVKNENRISKALYEICEGISINSKVFLDVADSAFILIQEYPPLKSTDLESLSAYSLFLLFKCNGGKLFKITDHNKFNANKGSLFSNYSIEFLDSKFFKVPNSIKIAIKHYWLIENHLAVKLDETVLFKIDDIKKSNYNCSGLERLVSCHDDFVLYFDALNRLTIELEKNKLMIEHVNLLKDRIKKYYTKHNLLANIIKNKLPDKFDSYDRFMYDKLISKINKQRK